VEVLAASGEFLARAAYSPASQIRARVWTFNPDEAVDAAFFRRRLDRSLMLRRDLQAARQIDSNALRWVYAESDGLPGFILDQYGQTLAAQVLSAGAEAWRDTLGALALELSGAAHLYERSDADARRLEGLPARKGAWLGGEPPQQVEIVENGVRLLVDVRGGHKTGYYLDQRDNRAVVRGFCAGKTVLDCFSYTGGFTLAAAVGGAAAVCSVDSSADAIQLARRNAGLNGIADGLVEWVEGDVFHTLRSFRDARRSFDLIVLDPPKFAQSASQVERAARGYKDINLLAFKLLKPAGMLFTFSCSGGVEADLFQKIVAGAALDAGVEARILMRLQQAPDHPVGLAFPEGAYLKGLVCAAP
jgi:23S rRNA (cytosine1962-C5)-methyltransferase